MRVDKVRLALVSNLGQHELAQANLVHFSYVYVKVTLSDGVNHKKYSAMPTAQLRAKERMLK